MMKTISYLLLAILSCLFPVDVEADDGLAELSALAATKRAAVLQLNVQWSPERFQPFLGAFVSGDGLALVTLSCLARPEQPSVVTANGTRLKLGTILGIFPEQELALIKFRHHPKVWLRIAPKEPEEGEVIAVLPIKYMDILNERVPPALGQVMVKRSGTTTNLRVTRFTRILSLGSKISREQGEMSTPGTFAIDRRGDLVGFTAGTQVERGQTLRFVAPIVALADQIGKLAEVGKAIPFPLPAATNPIDLALLDDDFRALDLGLRHGDWESAQTHLRKLLARYPDSLQLKLAATNPRLIDPLKPLVQLADFDPDPKEPAANQVAKLKARATLLALAKDLEGMVREFEAAIELSPKDCFINRGNLASLYMQLERPDDAERLYREAYLSAPESISLIEGFKDVLIAQRKIDEFAELAKRGSEVRRIYEQPLGPKP